MPAAPKWQLWRNRTPRELLARAARPPRDQRWRPHNAFMPACRQLALDLEIVCSASRRRHSARDAVVRAACDSAYARYFERDAADRKLLWSRTSRPTPYGLFTLNPVFRVYWSWSPRSGPSMPMPPSNRTQRMKSQLCRETAEHRPIAVSQWPTENRPMQTSVTLKEPLIAGNTPIPNAIIPDIRPCRNTAPRPRAADRACTATDAWMPPWRHGRSEEVAGFQ